MVWLCTNQGWAGIDFFTTYMASCPYSPPSRYWYHQACMTSCPYQACMYWYHQACMTSCPYQACMYWYHQGLYDLMSLPSMYVLLVVWGVSYELMSLPSRYGYEPGYLPQVLPDWVGFLITRYSSTSLYTPRLPPGTWPNPGTSVCVLTTDHPSAIHVPSNHQVPSTYLVTTKCHPRT
jgi:hypothetical protein